jgi:D-beta-D-heptose 7-phosphate kinase/D-beta-D-heptose 1-phosphate adenosyltransferase
MSPDSPAAGLRQILAAFPAKRVLAIGDLMLDEFIWGKVSRISPEAPVPVVNVTGESYYPGGAANVARNLRELTPHTAVMGVAGTDPAGCRLVEVLHERGIGTSGVQRDAGIRTSVKTRIIARNQQVVRVDREQKMALTPAQSALAMEQVERAAPEVDAIVVADYGKGFLSQHMADHICRVARMHGKILAVDPHPHTSLAWPGATAIKPNRAEAFLAAGVPASDPVSPPLADAPLLEVGELLRRRWGCGLLLITLGEDGMLLFEGAQPPVHIPARAQEVFDVSGAGDTAISVLAMALAAGAPGREAAELANYASGIAVGKLGTATVSIDEIAAVLESGAAG